MELYNIFLQHPIICTDSRNCQSGSIFFALKGENFNANAYAFSALENGCAYAVIDEFEYAIDDRFIVVENALETLQQLATYHRKQLNIPVLGITGTNGKTTTKELITSVLKEKYNVHYTQGNLNNHIGVPLTLLQLKKHHQLAVIEMGANHPGEIKLLAEIACPDYGLITNVGKAHLDGSGSFEGVKQTKSELYEYISKNGEMIFINSDNADLMEMSVRAGFDTERENVRAYSLQPNNTNCFVNGEITNSSPFLEMSCQILEERFEIKTNLIGTYNAENVMAAVAIGKYFGLYDVNIKNGLEKYIPQNNRSQLTITDRNKLIVDAYNANPTSMRAAILNFSQTASDKKTLILGDMFELGEYSHIEHQNIVDLLQQNKFNNVLLVGKDFIKTKNSYLNFANVSELTDYLISHPITDNYILIKGSRGVRLENILPIL
jgi:UDP-N-acetylmuramoyl-tripeptide--D-alanyl-D-alanine ligase